MKNKIVLLVFLALSSTAFAADDIISGLIRGISNAMECTPPDPANNPVEEIAQPSRLELRQMQTRKFNKDPASVAKAIQEMYKDQGLSCPAAVVPMYSCEGMISAKQVKGVMVQECLAPDGKSPGKYVKSQIAQTYERMPCRSKTISYDEKKKVRDKACNLVLLSYTDTFYEFDTNYPKNTETTVRIRMKATNKTMNDRIGWDTQREKGYINQDVIDPEAYSKAFKEIADGLFVDAIQLTPAEMR